MVCWLSLNMLNNDVKPPRDPHHHTEQGLWTRVSGAGGGLSSKERQRLQLLAVSR